MGKVIVGVMGPGDTATDEEMRTAYDLGKLIAQRGWILLTGGRNCGVMHTAGRGAKAAGGTVVGILPGADTGDMSESVDIPIVTGMLAARNSINVLSCRTGSNHEIRQSGRTCCSKREPGPDSTVREF